MKILAVPAQVSLRRDQTRADASDGEDQVQYLFEGEASVYNQPALIGSRNWGFVEWIAPGAAARNLGDDVRFLVNHDSSSAMGLPLARTVSGTLKLSETKDALVTNADLAPISLTRDLEVLIKRGDITQMSFAFTTSLFTRGTVNLSDPEQAGHAGIDIPKEFDGMPFERIDSFDRLYDVSAVTYPAYEGTSMTMNKARRLGEVTKEEIDAVVHATTRGMIDINAASRFALRLRQLQAS